MNHESFFGSNHEIKGDSFDNGLFAHVEGDKIRQVLKEVKTEFKALVRMLTVRYECKPDQILEVANEEDREAFVKKESEMRFYSGMVFDARDHEETESFYSEEQSDEESKDLDSDTEIDFVPDQE